MKLPRFFMFFSFISFRFCNERWAAWTKFLSCALVKFTCKDGTDGVIKMSIGKQSGVPDGLMINAGHHMSKTIHKILLSTKERQRSIFFPKSKQSVLQEVALVSLSCSFLRPFWDQNVQNLYPFSYQNDSKTIPFGTAHGMYPRGLSPAGARPYIM